MNKEQQELLDEVYENYSKMVWRITDIPLYGKKEFINKCKTDTEFSETWGLKIYTKVDGDKVWMGMVYNDNAVEIRLK
jgi:hypothetical protein